MFSTSTHCLIHPRWDVIFMCKHFPNTKPTTHLKSLSVTSQTGSSEQHVVARIVCIRAALVRSLAACVHSWASTCCLSPSFQGIPKLCFQEENAKQANINVRNGLVRWLLVAFGHRVADSVSFFFHQTCNIACLIFCSLLSFSLWDFRRGNTGEN